MNRICKVCKMYFASQVMLRKHDAQHKHQAYQVLPLPPIRPVRIAARRQRELMAVIALRESEDIEWVHEDEDEISVISRGYHRNLSSNRQSECTCHDSCNFGGASELTMGGSCWS